MRRFAFVAFLAGTVVRAQTPLYEWTDREGTANFTDNPATVPSEARSTLKRLGDDPIINNIERGSSTGGSLAKSKGPQARDTRPSPTPAAPRLGDVLSEANEAAHANRVGDAFDLFEAAASRHTDNASRDEIADDCGTIATWFLIRGRPDDARRFLRLARTVDASAAGVFLAEGELAFSQSDPQAAVAVWERGYRLHPGNTLLQSRLERARKESDALGSRPTDRSDHFIVSFEEGVDTDAAAFALETLEAFYDKVCDLYGTSLREPTRLILYPRRTFDATGSPEWAGGVFDGTIRVASGEAMAHLAPFRATLVHEFAHAVLRKATDGRRVPAWLNEGMSQVAEAIAEPSPEMSCLWGHGVPLARLPPSFIDLPTIAAVPAYRVSRHAAERLIALHGVESTQKLFKGLAAGMDFVKAFQEATGQSFERFAAAFDRQDSGY